MLCKPILLLLLNCALAFAQMQKSDELKLPDQLSETEAQAMLRERNAKPHVETALRLAVTRLTSALKNTQEHHYQAAAQDVDVYTALVLYADAYTRQLPANQNKDRNHCFKKLEQIIFKQTRTMETVQRELPYEYRDAALVKFSDVRKVRVRALDALLGGGKIINSSNE